MFSKLIPFVQFYRVPKLIKFNMPFSIPSSQLIWSKHGLQRMEERGVVIPKKGRWDFVGKTWNQQHKEETWALRYRCKKQDDLVIVVVKMNSQSYKVVTTYWE